MLRTLKAWAVRSHSYAKSLKVNRSLVRDSLGFETSFLIYDRKNFYYSPQTALDRSIVQSNQYNKTQNGLDWKYFEFSGHYSCSIWAAANTNNGFTFLIYNHIEVWKSFGGHTYSQIKIKSFSETNLLRHMKPNHTSLGLPKDPHVRRTSCIVICHLCH